MARKNDKLEPKVRISRVCCVCGQIFILPHPSHPRLMCEECQTALCEMIREYKNEQQKAGNAVRTENLPHAQS